MTTLEIPRASTTAKAGYKNFRNTL